RFVIVKPFNSAFNVVVGVQTLNTTGYALSVSTFGKPKSPLDILAFAARVKSLSFKVVSVAAKPPYSCTLFTIKKLTSRGSAGVAERLCPSSGVYFGL